MRLAQLNVIMFGRKQKVQVLFGNVRTVRAAFSTAEVSAVANVLFKARL